LGIARRRRWREVDRDIEILGDGSMVLAEDGWKKPRPAAGRDHQRLLFWRAPARHGSALGD
jgi:hypothetical protein